METSQIKIQFYLSIKIEIFLVNHGPRLWNALDHGIRTQSSVGRCKTSFKNILSPSM